MPAHNKNDRNYTKAMLWNVEGLKNILTMNSSLSFQDYDILLFTETFDTSDITINNFYGAHSPAKKGDRGRPSGGISCFIKPHLQPINVLDCTENTLSITTKIINIIGAYFAPNTQAETIIDELGKALENIDGDKPTILMGDLNCRIDKREAKTQEVIDFLMDYRLQLLNKGEEYTYIAPNGRSTIDLVFTNNQGHNQLEIRKVTLRKHLPVVVNIQVNRGTPGIEDINTPRVSRHIDGEKWLVKRTQIPTIMGNQKTIDETTAALSELILQATTETPKTSRTAKRWFDQECYAMRQSTLQKLNAAREQGNEALTEYATERRKYKQLLKEKKIAYDLLAEQKLIAEAEKTPHKVLRNSKKQKSNYPISMEQWELHFSNLLGEKGKTSNQFTLTTTPSQEIDPITTDEVIHHIRNGKNNKAAGPDGIYMEHLKDTLQDIAEPLTGLFNKCLTTNSIPQQWRRSNITVLYKGKGRKDDPNSYRGIALENVLFKLFSKILLRRIEHRLYASIPTTQYGFTPGRSTLHAVQEIMQEITSSITQHNTPLYAIFIDYSKAFDSINRSLLINKLQSILGRTSQELQTIKSILDANHIAIYDGITTSKDIIQTRGVLQGDPMSPVLFNVMTADIGNDISTEVKLLMYADDMAILSRNPEHLQSTMDMISEWAAGNTMEINSTKTKVMKFRRGGRLAKKDHFTCGQQPLEFVTHFKYLGVTFQTTGTTFTRHIEERAAAATKAVYDIPKLKLLSLPTAMALFKLKVMPAATYGIQLIWNHLTAKNLRRLESVKARFLKRTLSISKFSRNSYAYILAQESLFIEDIKLSFDLPATQAFTSVTEERQIKARQIPTEIMETEAMTTDTWKGPNFQLRHLYTRFAVHGFHGKICGDSTYHDPRDNCICKLCHEPCPKYHLTHCKSRTLSLSAHAKDW